MCGSNPRSKLKLSVIAPPCLGVAFAFPVWPDEYDLGAGSPAGQRRRAQHSNTGRRTDKNASACQPSCLILSNQLGSLWSPFASWEPANHARDSQTCRAVSRSVEIDLAPLVVLSDEGAEAALRTEGQLFQRQVAAGLIDSFP